MSPKYYENRRFCQKIADSVKKIAKRSVSLIIHIKRSLYASFGDLMLKTGGVPPFEKSKKIVENFCQKMADSVKKVAKRSVNLIIHIKRSLYARFGDLRLKTGGVPPF